MLDFKLHHFLNRMEVHNVSHVNKVDLFRSRALPPYPRLETIHGPSFEQYKMVCEKKIIFSLSGLSNSEFVIHFALS